MLFILQLPPLPLGRYLTQANEVLPLMEVLASSVELACLTRVSVANTVVLILRTCRKYPQCSTSLEVVPFDTVYHLSDIIISVHVVCCFNDLYFEQYRSTEE